MNEGSIQTGLKHKLSDKYQYQSYFKLIFFEIRRELLIQAEGGSGNDFVGSDKMAISSLY